jgi:hypothetical protein
MKYPMRIHDTINEKIRPDARRSTSPSIHIPGVLKALQDKQIPHRIVEAESEESKALTEWTERAFPVVHSQIDWSKVTSHLCVNWSALDDLVLEFEGLGRKLDEKSLVMVSWANALCPGLELELAGVVRIAREIFEEHETSTDVLVFSREEQWLIEMHHEGTLCMGRSPGYTE